MLTRGRKYAFKMKKWQVPTDLYSCPPFTNIFPTEILNHDFMSSVFKERARRKQGASNEVA